MFPSSSPSSSEEDERVKSEPARAGGYVKDEKKSNLVKSVLTKPMGLGEKGVHDSDSDDVVTLSEEEDEDDEELIEEEQEWSIIEENSTMETDEEAVFWLLSVFCEDLYPGYYTPTMADIQTDMLVLKQLIAEELPQLDEFTSEVGLPLELLGSQWLLCLFTTTFPSETVFRVFDCIFTEGSSFVFPAIMAHLRRLEPALLDLSEFHGVLSSIKDAENACIDGDSFMDAVCKEAEHISRSRIQKLRDEQRGSVRDEMQRAERARAFNQQLAIVYEIPAFSNYAAGLLRFFHEEAEVSSRSDVAFVLTMLCHGLVWFAEHSKRWGR
ncbi:hypothetical protein BBI17_002015 [Phytophthora kernoviae]|uniref:Rab-GAP TBC domain-containing protein n=2 Tax=Phytophthora kernoviae TaxID=325452 RepID=A0A421F1K9_9STRA|nr:hypothetical protein G195_003922 [Phytophthora kernoviae 00238/432]KAG2523724.1 hypothetical protein JM16_004971 [Phytophthora kernoviae]RLN14789.1 hypothetical protein BBI17_002015 [Phytophthora kernoviae]